MWIKNTVNFRPVLRSGLGLLIVSLLLGVSCKKKKRAASPSSPGADVLGSEDLAEGCASPLASINLPKANPAALKLASVDMSEVPVGSFSSAELKFDLSPGSPQPSKYIYWACSTSDKSKCVLGSSASTRDFNRSIPAKSVSIKAWACISPDRLPGPASSYAKHKLNLKGAGTYYCGAPVTNFAFQKSNAGKPRHASIQAEIDYLEAKAEQVAFHLAGRVEKHLKSPSLGLAKSSGSECANPKTSDVLMLCNIVNNKEIWVEQVVFQDPDEQVNVAAVQNYASKLPRGFGLTSTDDPEAASDCLPTCPGP